MPASLQPRLSRRSIGLHYALALVAILAWASGTALAANGLHAGLLHRIEGGAVGVLAGLGWIDALRERHGSRWFSVGWQAIARSLDALQKLLTVHDGRHRQHLRLLPGFMSLTLLFATGVVLAGLPSAVALDDLFAPAGWVRVARTAHRTLAAGLLTIALVDVVALLLSRLPRRAPAKAPRPLAPRPKR